MIDAGRLLADLKKLRKKLEEDLRSHHQVSAQRAVIESEWREALNTKRTADTFDTFFDAAVDQAAVHWILALVFLRFLEDNRLLDRPVVAGPGERLEVAQFRQREWFRTRPEDSDAEYLLAVFEEVARFPGLAGLFDPSHNPLFRLPISGDGAIALFDFFRQRSPDTGELLHDLTDTDWNTRFLGDLYQDLSEEARKRFALLQTPEFVEAWILSRTLDPAIREFGHEQVRMIDPTCGSGHFLLGGFARLLEQWRRHAPEMPPAAQAQKALDAVAGVDLNPFAVEIARFRLLVAALRAAGETRLAAAPDFRLQLAVGDSLLHGRHFFRHELGGTDEGFRRILQHHYMAEDTSALDSILGRQYHAVVGNPPYITPKDAAMRDAYREIYESCYRTYGLGVPFIERFFDLAQDGTQARTAGFVGLIVANSFMKREFGKRLIEVVLPRLDLTHIVDTSSAYIPGHTTPTVILFGRKQAPVSGKIRTVRVVSGAPEIPVIPADGPVWTAIKTQADLDRSVSEFISSEDTPRSLLFSHPWSLGGGGASDVKATIEAVAGAGLAAFCDGPIGGAVRTGADPLFRFGPTRHRHSNIPARYFRPFLEGEGVRDWAIAAEEVVYYPPVDDERVEARRELWGWRTTLAKRVTFQGIMEDAGLLWTDYMQHTSSTYKTPLSIAFGEITTHNHFGIDRGGNVFAQTAPVIKLLKHYDLDHHFGLLGLLNSSVGCFWMKQVMSDKGGGGIGGGLKSEFWDRIFVFNSTKLERFPVVERRDPDLAHDLDTAAQRLAQVLPTSQCGRKVPRRESLEAARAEAQATRTRMIALQEELDWRNYRLYGLIGGHAGASEPPTAQSWRARLRDCHGPPRGGWRVGDRWFERHRSTPITELPTCWPADYRAVVERRIALIESDPTVGLIERPEYKRRWSAPTWEEMERSALRVWLLDRLESRRFWPAGEPRMLSARSLADAARHDAEFLAVAELYAGRAGFDLETLVAELVVGESVPFLAVLRYTDTGRRKRADWEATWEKQRVEDAIDADLASRRQEFEDEAWARAYPRKEGETAEAYGARMAVGLKVEFGFDGRRRRDRCGGQAPQAGRSGRHPCAVEIQERGFSISGILALARRTRRPEGALGLFSALRARCRPELSRSSGRATIISPAPAPSPLGTSSARTPMAGQRSA